MFGWCEAGQHNKCIRTYDQFYVDPRRGIVYTGESRTCQCPKRGCPCYVPAKDRSKKKAKRKGR